MKKSAHPITEHGREFISKETISGIILVIAAVVAIIWANSPWGHSYHYVWHELHMEFAFGNWFDLDASLNHWINDGLMAIFFFTVGLEIKREVMEGELSSLKKASMPIMAAVGGMIVPAAIYTFFNYDNPSTADGWGIPMATDIGFTLGVLSLLGNKVSINLKIFLTALAIADDLGAIMVIALFYTDPASIDFNQLWVALIFIAILVVANKVGIRSGTFYGIVGLFGVWIAFVYSGIHATFAGVLIAITIPARSKITENEFMKKAQGYAKVFTKNKSLGKLLSSEQAHAVSSMEKALEQVQTPLQKLEHAIHPFVAYIVLPLFALSNAGIEISGSIIDMLLEPVALGVMCGLVLGKFIGISVFSKLMVKLKFSSLPDNVAWMEIYGAAMLAGIGFTMSIFITDLAFDDKSIIENAKVGVMAASLISALLGLLILKIFYNKRDSE
jgi:NhaA family Na+:H+ antiporter